jgi:hypothetical protein
MLAGTRVPPPQLDEFFLDFDRHPSVATSGFAPLIVPSRPHTVISAASSPNVVNLANPRAPTSGEEQH